ncbi:hypothetical protein [Xenorhabdus griffiniae]|uniref:hypothetical protein n=1 Tax=Xenorhabdus griffiniae TaxID=351672 RepID=UPI0023596976|nr:hypothetical protein [Xenorhabdus griffiniae]MDC9603722.1 hypothetical protein [Xenorhabdus griffiniae]
MANNPKRCVGGKKVIGAKPTQSAASEALPCAGWRCPTGMTASEMMALCRPVAG